MNYQTDVVTTYAQMVWWRDQFLKQDGPRFLIVIGRPGTGKSKLFRDHVPDDSLYLSGALSAFHFYTQLHQYVDKLVTIDDVDSLFTDKSAINLLKCLCNTDERKTVFWGKRNKQMESERIPHSFETTSRVCILANTLKAIEANLAAVLDRAFVLHFEPTFDEVHREVWTWFEDAEVYKFIERHRSLISSPSMRLYEKAANMRRMNGDWQNWLIRQWVSTDTKLGLVAQIMADSTLATAEQRVARFAELGGGSRPTYMRKQAQWRKLMGISSRKVA